MGIIDILAMAAFEGGRRFITARIYRTAENSTTATAVRNIIPDNRSADIGNTPYAP